MKNKICGFVLSVVILITMLPTALAAETEITITGGEITGVPLTVSLSDGTEASGTWQISADGTEFTDITLNSYTDTVSSYAIKPGNKNKYIRYAQEIDGEVKYSNIVGPLPASKGPNTNQNSNWQGLNKAPDADYVFKPSDGQSFTLLDTTNASADGLFVIANVGYGRIRVGNSGKFDPSNSDSLASKLDSLAETGSWSADWYGNAKTFSLPTSIKNNLKEHSWLTDAGHANSATPADYIYSGKLSVLSYTEWMKYKGIIGYRLQGNVGADWWTLRTGSNSGANTMHIVTQTADVSNSGRVVSNAPTALTDIRPCFYLDKDYFLNNKIDVESAGSVVKEYIRNAHSLDDMMNNGYTFIEVAKLGYDVGEIPEVTDVSVSYSGIKGEPIKAEYTLSENADPKKTEVKWYISNAANGHFEIVQKNEFTDVGDLYYVKPTDANKYFKCEVIPSTTEGIPGEAVKSDNAVGPVQASVGPCTVYSDTTGVNENTPAEYVFSLYGESEEFILLDAENRETEGIFMFTKGYYGRKRWSDTTSSENVIFNPEKQGTFAYNLNNSFFENGWKSDTTSSTYTLSKEMKKHIIEHTWFTEAGYITSGAPADYKVTCKLAPLSLSEWKIYKNKIGHTDNCADNYWCLRTARGDQQTLANTMLTVQTKFTNAGQGRVNQVALNYGYDVRFGFYVDGDFFKKVKIEPKKAGSEVLKVLRETCELSDLKALGYTESEISILGYDKLPTISNIGFVGVMATGQKIGVSYDTELGDKTKTEYEWYVLDTPDGEMTKISDSPTVVLDNSYKGKYVRVVLRPISEGGVRGNKITYDSKILLDTSDENAAFIENVSKSRNVVTANLWINGNGTSFSYMVVAYDQNGKVIQCIKKPYESSIISETVPEATHSVKVFCISMDSLLRPIAFGKYVEG